MNENTFTYWFLDFLVIALACSLVEFVFEWVHNMKRKKIEENLCDLCAKPRKLISSKDKKLWLCRQCSKVYRENKLQEQKENQ